jgi:hypothetical protein
MNSLILSTRPGTPARSIDCSLIRYLVLTILYHANVMQRPERLVAGTPFAL